MRNIFTFLVCFFSVVISAQEDTIVLKDLVVTDIRIQKNKTQYIQKLNDSVIASNSPLLSEILNYNTPVYFKENGYGMVSSPSFRGTTASQTTVLWNGLRINSGFLGQTDFNTISSLGYDEILVKPGGGSVAHGSGAIGGSVHLNHKLRFNKGLKNRILFSWGDYNTFNYYLNSAYSNDKFAVDVGFNRNSSDNDYEVKELNYINENGQFYNQTFNVNAGYKFNEFHRISAFIENYNDERHFSLTMPGANKTKYQNQNLRSLLQYDQSWNRLTSVVKLALMKENWDFWQQLEANSFSGGEIQSWLAGYDGSFALNPKANIDFFAQYRKDKATGSGGGIEEVGMDYAHSGILFSHQIFHKFYYEAGIRKEFGTEYDSPLLFSFSAEYIPIKAYEIHFNYSKNFKMPSFNDLYWQPGGNPDLKAETAIQFEMVNIFKFQRNQLGFNLYHNQVKDMIRWLPSGMMYWSPMNVDEVKIRGLEVFSEFKKSVGKHHFSLNNSYAYTESVNPQTGKQLSYVPFHKINGTFSHQFHNFSWFFQGLYTGKIFTTVDENPDYTLSDYQVFNLGFKYLFGKKIKFEPGFFIKNVFNKAYEAYPYRIMPGRNISAQIQIQF
ncbi:MAG: TonB-dependent receptor [Flavobacteriaceae bacterium]|nr:TonB-dependent receptor [Flavobacteriaceae bacterium]